MIMIEAGYKTCQSHEIYRYGTTATPTDSNKYRQKSASDSIMSPSGVWVPKVP